MPEPKQHRALLAVHDTKARSALRGYFRSRGDVMELHADASTLAATAREARPCLIVLELPGEEGLEARLRRELPEAPVIVLAPHYANVRVEAAQWEGCALLRLPFAEGEIDGYFDEIFESLSCKCQAAPAALDSGAAYIDMPAFYDADSPRMNEARKIIRKVANTSAAVLIRGESGVGKEVAARMVFQLSDRRTKPFVKVNCAAIPSDLLESELFGYEAGAFTGAQRPKPGKFELADGGTLFLDEIAEMHPVLQAKLLHVLQDGEFARLGAKQDTTVDVRIICATNRQLEARVADGLFREDLFYRINVVTVEIPPLRERVKEIPILIQGFLERYAALYGRMAPPLDSATMDAILGYHWPGNIRELENFCKRYVILGDATAIMHEWHTRHVAPAGERRRQLRRKAGETVPAAEQLDPDQPGRSLLEIGREAARQAEGRAIQSMLVATHWNRREAAKRLRVSYKALLNKIKMMENGTSR